MNIKKALTISALPVMVLVLSGCGAKPTTQAPAPTTSTNTTPAQTQTAPTKSTAETSVQQPLPPLPANNKAAIDTEVKNIDTELQAADNAIAKDTKDASLGL